MTIDEFDQVFSLAVRQYQSGFLEAPPETLVRDLLAGINYQEKMAADVIRYDTRNYATLIAARRRQSRIFRLKKRAEA